MKYCLLNVCPTLNADCTQQGTSNKTCSNSPISSTLLKQPLRTIKMYQAYLLLVVCLSSALADRQMKVEAINSTLKISTTEPPVGCACGIFLSGQFKKGSKEPPKGNPALINDLPDKLPCTPTGNRLCINKCLETIIKHLPNGPKIICSSIEHDCHKERAYLFIKNCKSEWINTNLSAGREYCCKNGTPYKCPAY